MINFTSYLAIANQGEGDECKLYSNLELTIKPPTLKATKWDIFSAKIVASRCR